jgi:hypothetical protein
MTARAIETILEAARPAADPGAAFEITFGDVTGVSPLEVRIAGDTTSTQIGEYAAAYTPTSNDRVIVLRLGPTWIILGDLT